MLGLPRIDPILGVQIAAPLVAVALLGVCLQVPWKTFIETEYHIHSLSPEGITHHLYKTIALGYHYISTIVWCSLKMPYDGSKQTL